MICTLALFKAGVLAVAISVPTDALTCRGLSDQYLLAGYAVRREWHKPQVERTPTNAQARKRFRSQSPLQPN